jgi:hypothetical protein
MDKGLPLVYAVVKIWILVFRGMMTYSFVAGCQCFGGKYCSHAEDGKHIQDIVTQKTIRYVNYVLSYPYLMIPYTSAEHCLL